MSEMARKAREAMKAKASRMSHGDPHEKVDASSWTPPEPMNANAQTGMRPVSKRQFRRGGKVHGEKPACRADRKPRKSGGRVDDYVNRDVRAANADLGKPHVGGFKDGGGTNFRKRMHAEVGQSAAHRSHKRNGGGQFVERSHKAGGGLSEILDSMQTTKPTNLAVDPEAGRGSSDGGGGMKRGGRSKRARGGRAKGKTNIVINVTPPAPQMASPPPQMMPKPPVGIPVPPPAPPSGMPPGGMSPMGLGAGGPQMPMPRKSGGRATYPTIASAKRVRSPKDMDAGSLGGLGRIEKTAIAERTYARAK